MRVLFVCKDITPAHYMSHLLDAVPDGYHVDTVLDPTGVARKAFSSSFYESFEDLKSYDLVLSGCSVDSTLEKVFLDIAQTCGVRTMAINDFPGAFARHSGKFADSYLVTSAWAKINFPETFKSIDVGDINVVTLPSPSSKAISAFESWAAGKQVVFWLAKSDIESLEVILDALQPSQKLLCGLHPDPSRWPNQQRILEVQALLGDRFAVVSDIEKSVSSLEALKAFSPSQLVVVTTFTGAALTAAYNEYRVLTVDSKQDGEIRNAYLRANPNGSTEQFQLPFMFGSPVVQNGHTGDVFGLNYPDAKVIQSGAFAFNPGSTWDLISAS